MHPAVFSGDFVFWFSVFIMYEFSGDFVFGFSIQNV